MARENRQPHSVDAAFIVGYLGIPATMTSYSRLNLRRGTTYASGYVYFKPLRNEDGKLKSGIQYHRILLGYHSTYVSKIINNIPTNVREYIHVDYIEDELVKLIAYLADPPKNITHHRRFMKRI